MANAPRNFNLVVRQLQDVLQAAHPDAVVLFSLPANLILDYQEAASHGISIGLNVRVDPADPESHVVWLRPAEQVDDPPQAEPKM